MAEKIYAKNPEIVFRKIADEVILVPIKNKVGDLANIYTLNEVAARAWDLLDGQRNIGAIEECLTNEFEVSPEEIRSDLQELFAKFLEAGCVKEA